MPGLDVARRLWQGFDRLALGNPFARFLLAIALLPSRCDDLLSAFERNHRNVHQVREKKTARIDNDAALNRYVA